jgi:hypothetical protein
MRTLAPVVALAMVLIWPLAARAQQAQPQQQTWTLHDPNEYTQEDSHPVRAIASLLSPIGWALEWGVARPWHYVATQTPLAPLLNGGQDDDSWDEYYGGSGPIAEAPIMPPPAPVREQSAANQPGFHEQNLGSSSTPPAHSTAPSSSSPAIGAPPVSAIPQGQATLH